MYSGAKSRFWWLYPSAHKGSLLSLHKSCNKAALLMSITSSSVPCMIRTGALIFCTNSKFGYMSSPESRRGERGGLEEQTSSASFRGSSLTHRLATS